MKTGISVIAFLLIACIASAQASWTVTLNNKLLLRASKENEKTNSRKVKATEWKKKGFLDIVYTSPKTDNKYRRSILFVNENDQELIRRDNVSKVRVPIDELKRIFKDSGKIRVFTISIPTDPDLASRVRVRRVHLCTLELK